MTRELTATAREAIRQAESVWRACREAMLAQWAEQGEPLVAKLRWAGVMSSPRNGKQYRFARSEVTGKLYQSAIDAPEELEDHARFALESDSPETKLADALVEVAETHKSLQAQERAALRYFEETVLIGLGLGPEDKTFSGFYINGRMYLFKGALIETDDLDVFVIDSVSPGV